MDPLALDELLIKCMRCGDCQAVCPTYQATRDEVAVARGRIRLLRAEAGGMETGPKFREALSTCLLCRACTSRCPSGVEVDSLVLDARGRMAERDGLPPAYRLAFGILERPPLTRLAFRIGALLQGAVLSPAWKDGHMTSRRVMGLGGRAVPRLRAPFALPPGKASGGKSEVALFPGCLTNYVYPQVGRAAVEVLRRNGVEVVLPGGGCCGMPMLAAGDRAGAVRAAEANVERLGGVETVVTPCPTCALALKERYPVLLEGRDSHDAALELGRKTHEMCTYLGGMELRDGKLAGRITYHDPCHLNWGLGVKEEPRALLRSLGLELREMARPEACCGFGGTFSLKNYDLAVRINDKKLEDIAGTEAGIVATPCPGCRMHIEDGLNRRRMAQRVLHPVELMAMGYGGGNAQG